MEPAFLRKPPFHSPVLETTQARSGGAGRLSQLLDNISSHDCLFQQCFPQHPLHWVASGTELRASLKVPIFFPPTFCCKNDSRPKWYHTPKILQVGEQLSISYLKG